MGMFSKFSVRLKYIFMSGRIIGQTYFPLQIKKMSFKLAQGKFPAGQLLLAKISSIKWYSTRVNWLVNVFSKDEKYIITEKDFWTFLAVNIAKMDGFCLAHKHKQMGWHPRSNYQKRFQYLLSFHLERKKKKVQTIKEKERKP